VAERGATWLTILAGLAAGGGLLLWPGVPLRGFLLVFGGWAILTGASHVLAARGRGQDGEAATTTTLGWLLAGLGLVLVLWPQTGVVAIAWVIALAALVTAALLLFIAVRLRRLQGRVAEVR
jgi:uncharacterized membrane protein HdeD (DUF308 family)